MNPKPLSSLNHFTVPVLMINLFLEIPDFSRVRTTGTITGERTGPTRSANISAGGGNCAATQAICSRIIPDFRDARLKIQRHPPHRAVHRRTRKAQPGYTATPDRNDRVR